MNHLEPVAEFVRLLDQHGTTEAAIELSVKRGTRNGCLATRVKIRAAWMALSPKGDAARVTLRSAVLEMAVTYPPYEAALPKVDIFLRADAVFGPAPLLKKALTARMGDLKDWELKTVLTPAMDNSSKSIVVTVYGLHNVDQHAASYFDWDDERFFVTTVFTAIAIPNVRLAADGESVVESPQVKD